MVVTQVSEGIIHYTVYLYVELVNALIEQMYIYVP